MPVGSKPSRWLLSLAVALQGALLVLVVASSWATQDSAVQRKHTRAYAENALRIPLLQGRVATQVVDAAAGLVRVDVLGSGERVPLRLRVRSPRGAVVREELVSLVESAEPAWNVFVFAALPSEHDQYTLEFDAPTASPTAGPSLYGIDCDCLWGGAARVVNARNRTVPELANIQDLHIGTYSAPGRRGRVEVLMDRLEQYRPAWMGRWSLLGATLGGFGSYCALIWVLMGAAMRDLRTWERYVLVLTSGVGPAVLIVHAGL